MRNPFAAPMLSDVAVQQNLTISVTAMDVDNDASVQTAIAAIQARQGPVDVLVNNAGIERFGSIEETSIQEFRAVMETNYFGALRCIQSVVPSMRERRSGTIVNVSSVAGTFSHPPGTPYCASKWALEALTEGLAGEMKAFRVHVALIEPGIIATDMAQRINAWNTEARMRETTDCASEIAVWISCWKTDRNELTSRDLVAEVCLRRIAAGTGDLGLVRKQASAVSSLRPAR